MGSEDEILGHGVATLRHHSWHLLIDNRTAPRVGRHWEDGDLRDRRFAADRLLQQPMPSIVVGTDSGHLGESPDRESNGARIESRLENVIAGPDLFQCSNGEYALLEQQLVEELANQIYKVALALGDYLKVKAHVCILEV